ncbi:hypothetical protein CDL15_Pgr023402 [Punica granatum]|uniref:Aminotransferase class I/classII large domain-containing protein n=1 Tax=Punica granatum TaxID=22663 RepID=A0A218Y2J8_PUNGR|nr:hypothetical protein CDL15_Pgr023402 [Punica granatum]
MESGLSEQRWKFRANEFYTSSSTISVRGILGRLWGSLSEDNPRPVIPLGHGDPSVFPCFCTSPVAEGAIFESVSSGGFNCYSYPVGILPARSNLEMRHFDLLPERGWEVDLMGVEKLADENTVAMVIVNPGNPCGNVYSYDHLKKVAEMAKKLGIMVISDEVYAHLVFGNTPFTPMGVFGSIAPVLTLGSISKRWIVPGWRLGWLVTTDPNGILTKHGVVESIKGFLSTSPDPATFIQGAVPQILEKTPDDFFSRTIDVLKQTADICYEMIKDIPCITGPYKPEGSMFVMVKLNLSMLDGVKDDVDFCMKLSKEESVIVLPGVVVGMKNWLRITFTIEPSLLRDGLERIKAFYERHAKAP